MRMVWWLCVLSFVCFVLSYKETQTTLPFPAEERIIGGTAVPSDPNPYPWIVHLFVQRVVEEDGANKTTIRFCGGNLIQENIVLTAAHCVEGDNVVEILFGLGTKGNAPSQSQSATMSSCVMHPGYNASSFANDIALFLLPKPFLINKFPILPTTRPAIGTNLVVAGWGSTSGSPDEQSSVLMQVTVPVRSDDACTRALFPDYHASTELCAGSPGADSCYGDSGGPLFDITDCCQYPGTVLYGLTSYGVGCGTNPGVYTSVAAYRDWIDEVIATNFGVVNRINRAMCCMCDSLWPGDTGYIKSCAPSPTPPQAPSLVVTPAPPYQPPKMPASAASVVVVSWVGVVMAVVITFLHFE